LHPFLTGAEVEFFDAIDVYSIPANTEAAATYCDLAYAASWGHLCARFPHLLAIGRLVSIAALPSTRARILDIEEGNPGTPDDIVEFVKDGLAHGIYRPGPYGNGPVIVECRARLVAAGLHPGQFSCWLADWDGNSAIPAGCAAKQIRDAGPYDIDYATADFFPALPAPANARGVAKFSGEVDLLTGHWTIKGEPGDFTPGSAPKLWEAKLSLNNKDGAWGVASEPAGK